MHVAVPPRAEYEEGFVKWIEHLSRMAAQLSCKITFYGDEVTLSYIMEIASKYPAASLTSCEVLENWSDFERIKKNMAISHMAVIISARRGTISYDTHFEKLPSNISKHFSDNNLIVLYPEQFSPSEDILSFSDPMGHNESQHYNNAREWITGLLKTDDE